MPQAITWNSDTQFNFMWLNSIPLCGDEFSQLTTDIQ